MGGDTNQHDLRVTAHDEGLKVRITLLEDIRDGKVTDTSIIAACRTQAGLANLSLSIRGLAPMSLNTLKAAANRDSPTRWSELDKLRRNAIQLGKALKSSSPKESSSQPTALTKLDESFRTRALLYRAYSNLLSIVDAHTVDGDILYAKLVQHKETFRIDIGLRVVHDSDENQ